MIGVARICTQAVEYSAQTKSGILNQDIPGARILWIVTMKFKPVRMDEKPRMNAAASAGMTFVVVRTLYGT